VWRKKGRGTWEEHEEALIPSRIAELVDGIDSGVIGYI
jgi:hypothetical protein